MLRAGGNAVDAALAAMLMAWVTEPLLTGPGAGGYMLVAAPGAEPVALDFFVEAPGRAGRERGAELQPVSVDFGDTTQVFNIGPASVGAYGTPAGIAHAHGRWGSVPLADLAAPAAAAARSGVVLNAGQTYVLELLAGLVRSSPEASALFAPAGRLLAEGERWIDEELGTALERFGAEGAEPFYRGDLAERIAGWVCERGGILGAEDLAAYAVRELAPVEVAYRGTRVLTAPPSSAGGLLVARSLAVLGAEPGSPGVPALVRAMRAAQDERTEAFLGGLADPGFAAEFTSSRLGSTTHVSALDADGWACSATCSNGVGSGVIVPGTSVHLNNMLGEEDLNPHGFHRYPPGRRLPSMMTPAIVLAQGRPEVVLGSAGSNRIRSAVLQVIVNVVDRGMDAEEAVRAPRVHFEAGQVWAEPGVDTSGLAEPVSPFGGLSMYFGGAQVVVRDPATGELTGGGDPRRGGAVAVA